MRVSCALHSKSEVSQFCTWLLDSVYCTGFDFKQGELMFSTIHFCVLIVNVQTTSYIRNTRMKWLLKSENRWETFCISSVAFHVK